MKEAAWKNFLNEKCKNVGIGRIESKFLIDFFFQILDTFNFSNFQWQWLWNIMPGNTKGGSITVPLTSCLTSLESVVWQLTIFVFICKKDLPKPVKQEINGTMILPPLVFPDLSFKIVNYCLNTSIYSYSKTSGGQNSNLYLTLINFLNTSVT
jgi:hypothetical protein